MARATTGWCIWRLSNRRATARAIVAVAFLAVGSIVVLGQQAIAAVTSSVTAGVLTVTSDDQGDEIVVRCSAGGFVRVNGARPDTGAVACADVTSIVVNSGAGDDEIRLSKLGPLEFTALQLVSIDAGDGDDLVVGSQVEDSIVAGTGDDRISATPEAGDTVQGDEGFDHLTTEIVADTTIADDGFTFPSGTIPVGSVEEVSVTSSEAAVTVDASAFSGPLTVRTLAGDDEIFGGTGENVISSGDGNDEITGGPSKDRITAGAGADRILGLAGQNQLWGAGGNDVMIGGPDQDIVTMGDGADVANGSGGNDRFRGLGGPDVARGGSGNDAFELKPSRQGETLAGGDGRDRVTLRIDSRAALTDSRLATDSGTWPLRSIEHVELRGWEESGDMMIDARRFSGSTVLNGDYGDDALLGGSGRDWIFGSVGDDLLVGGRGADLLDGWEGDDACDGGPGNDRLVRCESRS